jgi:hypothetical protein
MIYKAYFICLLTAGIISARADMVRLEQLDLSNVIQGWGTPRAGKSVEGKPMQIGDTAFTHGLGSHGPGQLAINLHKTALRFEAHVGIDAETAGRGSVVFQAFVDDKKVFDSGKRTGSMPAMPVSLDLRDADSLHLVFTDGGDGFDFDHADLADARLTFAGTQIPTSVPLFTSDGFVTRRPPRLDPLCSPSAVTLARQIGRPCLKWSADLVNGYHILEIQAGSTEIKTHKGNRPVRITSGWLGEQKPHANDALIVQSTAKRPIQVRVLQQPRLENNFKAFVEIEASMPATRLDLTLFYVPLTNIFNMFHPFSGPSDTQQKAEKSELNNLLAEACGLWETVALNTRDRELRLFALERYYALLPFSSAPANSVEHDKINEALSYYSKMGIKAAPVFGRRIIWVVPQATATNAAVLRALAEADAANAFLCDLTGNDNNERVGYRLIVRYMAESNYGGALYGGHGVGLGGKGPSIPFVGRAGFYHEISHDLIHGPNILGPFPGFGEGWATFAAVPMFDYLGWDDWSHSLAEKFRLSFRYHRDNGARFDELPGYDANAGFILHLTDRLCSKSDWTPLRDWLHLARKHPEPDDPSLRIDRFVSILRQAANKTRIDDEFLKSLGLETNQKTSP